MQLEPRLRAFAAVARERSVSRAAGQLFLSQPAVSKHLAALEREVGTSLVARGRFGASLTPAGQLLADYVLRAEALLANAERALASDADAESGVLEIAASGIPGTYLLPPLLAAFQDSHPRIEVRFSLATSAGALETVRTHHAELAVVGGLNVPPELDAEALVEDHIVLVGGAAFAGRAVTRRELETLLWITREEGSSTRLAVEGARVRMGLHPVRTLDLPSWEAVKLAVAAGTGIAAISQLAIRHELTAGHLALLDVRGWRLMRTIAVVIAHDVPMTTPARLFLDQLRAIRFASPGTDATAVRRP